MNLLQPSLLQKLARSRLAARSAVPTTGIGERRSKTVGAGMEFADHRPYQPGDDVRHLDRHLHARLGGHYIKQYSLYQQLRVTILVDASGSMAAGAPVKFDYASALAGALAFVGLAGGDLVQVGTITNRGLHWFPVLNGSQRTPHLLAWLARQRAGGAANLGATVRMLASQLRPGGLLVIVSDWLVEGADEALSLLAAAGQELLAVQVLSPEEVEPELLGDGEVCFADSETGREVELSLDPDVHAQYRAKLTAWQESLREAVTHRGGRFVNARSDLDLETLLLHDWRAAGLIT